MVIANWWGQRSPKLSIDSLCILLNLLEYTGEYTQEIPAYSILIFAKHIEKFTMIDDNGYITKSVSHE